MDPFFLPDSERQQQFSIAFIHSIASAAGYGLERIVIDQDSVDVLLRQYTKGITFPTFSTLYVQLKCTYAHSPTEDGFFHYPLKLKNYDELRSVSMDPKALVVVHVPDKFESWLTHGDDSLALRYTAYWVSLRGAPASPNTTSVTVKVPPQNRFTVEELRRLMQLLAEGKIDLC